MSKVSSTCLQSMSQSQKNLMAWRLNWILGREFYRAHQETMKKAYWDALAWSNFGPPANPNFTDGDPDLKAFRTQVKVGFEANTPGWDNATCSLDLPSLACFCFYLASISDNAPMLAQAVALMQTTQADIPYLKDACPSEVAEDISYVVKESPPSPGNQTCKPSGAACAADAECCENMACDQGKCTYSKGVIPDNLPPGDKTGSTTTTTDTPGTATPVGAKEDTGEKKINWWLWGGIGAAVIVGAALIGAGRDPEYVYTPPAPNPSKKGKLTDWDLIKKLGPDGYAYCSIASIDDPTGEWLRRFRREAEAEGLSVEIRGGVVYVLPSARVNPSKKKTGYRKGPFEVQVQIHSRRGWITWGSYASMKLTFSTINNLRPAAQDLTQFDYPEKMAEFYREIAEGRADVRVLDSGKYEIYFGPVPTGRKSNPSKKGSKAFKPFTRRGNYVDLIGTEGGNLILRPTKEGVEYAKELAENDRGEETNLFDILEDHITNSEWEFIRPEEVGALTEGTILTEEAVRDDHGDLKKIGRVYWHERYQIEDPIETWSKGKDVIFLGA